MSISDGVIVALIGAAAVLLAQLINQRLAHSLKKKEFRIEQIKSWIKIIEAAEVIQFDVPEKKDTEEKTDFLLRAINDFCIKTTSNVWKKYTEIKHILLISEEERANFEELIEKSKRKSADAVGERLKVGLGIEGTPIDSNLAFVSDFTDISTKITKEYESLRITTLSVLHKKLREEMEMNF